jgi:hypothetical protein
MNSSCTNSSSRSTVLEERGVQVIRGNVTDPAAVERMVADCHVVFHLPRAAGASFLGSDRVFDMSRARQDLSYAPTVGVREAVRRMVAWYREQGLV